MEIGEPKGAQGKTLVLRSPLGGVLLRALLAFLGCLLIIEVLLRILVLSSITSKFLPPFSLGTGFPQFDIKLAYLDRFVRSTDGLPCVIIGSSMSDAALDPKVLDDAYYESTQSTLECFNFSLAGAKMGEIVEIGRMLERRYHPGLVILETSPRSFSSEIGVDIAEPLLASDWFRYQQGNFNFRGWLIDRSFLYRAYLRIQEISSKMNKPVFDFWYGEIHPDGYTPITFLRDENGDPLKEYRFSTFVWDKTLRRAYLDYLDLPGRETHLVVFETPFFVEATGEDARNTADPYEKKYLQELIAMTSFQEIPFLRSMDEGGIQFSAGDWYDRAHLNEKGSGKFSRWLAEKLAGMDELTR